MGGAVFFGAFVVMQIVFSGVGEKIFWEPA
jgi:hypothetical protein